MTTAQPDGTVPVLSRNGKEPPGSCHFRGVRLVCGVITILAFAKDSIARPARESKGNLFPRKLPLRGGRAVLCFLGAPTSRPSLPRESKCPGDTSVKSKARQRTLILLAAAGDWGVETLGDGVSLRIRSNTSCLLSQRYRSLQRSHPSVICFANATSP